MLYTEHFPNDLSQQPLTATVASLNKPLSETGQIDQDLSALINLSGKLRMLSHQVVMCALLNVQNGTDFKTKGRAALDEFREISRKFMEPGPATGLAAATAAILNASDIVTDVHISPLRDFISRAEALCDTMTPQTLAQLGTFVSGPLLASLNALNDSIRVALDEQIAQRSRAQEPLLRATTSSLGEINRLAKSLQIVAMNASLEAQRAGEFGTAFGEIAREMRSLSIKSLEQADRLDADLTQFRASQTTVTGRPV